MATIRLKQTTTATPEQFVAALTDFGPGRSKLFSSKSSIKLPKVFSSSVFSQRSSCSARSWAWLPSPSAAAR